MSLSKKKYKFDDCKFLWYKHPYKEKYRRYITRLNYKEGQLLYKYSNLAKNNIIEVGRWYGGSTYIISCATQVPVYSIDMLSLEERRDWIIKNQRNKEWRGVTYPYYGNISNINMENKLKQFTNLVLCNKKTTEIVFGEDIPRTYDVLFIDGDHSWEGVVGDIFYFWDYATKYIIFHDYHKKAIDVYKAVNILIKNKCATIVEQVDTTIVLRKDTNYELSDRWFVR